MVRRGRVVMPCTSCLGELPYRRTCANCNATGREPCCRFCLDGVPVGTHAVGGRELPCCEKCLTAFREALAWVARVPPANDSEHEVVRDGGRRG